MKLHTSQLNEIVEQVAIYGGNPTHPAVLAKFADLQLSFDAEIDQNLSPFSDLYFAQQVALYNEISGRQLDQQSGELHPVEADSLLVAANPLGIQDVGHLSGHVHALSTMLAVATLTSAPRVLDMGAGHGVSSEIFAFCGCKVHAVDIDPALGEVSRKRAEARNLDIVRSDLNFDDLGAIENGSYEAAFFFQSFHHCLRPWDLIAQLRRKLVPTGIIGFVGEPMQSAWWKNWGIRLDIESLYVARQQGWFESGFSRTFITECFSRNGMDIAFFSGGHSGGAIGVASADPQKLQQVRSTARTLGLQDLMEDDGLDIADTRYSSRIGVLSELLGRPAFAQLNDATGALLFGPYIDLDPGEYEYSAIVCCKGPGGTLRIDIASETGASIHFQEELDALAIGSASLIIRRVTFTEKAHRVELRAWVLSGSGWAVEIPKMRHISSN